MTNLRRTLLALASTLSAIVAFPDLLGFLSTDAHAGPTRSGSGVCRCRTENEVIGEIDPFRSCPAVEASSPPAASVSDYYITTEVEFDFGSDITERWTIPGFADPIERFFDWQPDPVRKWYGPCPDSYGDCYISPGTWYFWPWYQYGPHTLLTAENLGTWRYEEIVGGYVVADIEFEVKEIVLTDETNVSRIGIVDHDLSAPFTFRLSTFEDTPSDPHPVPGETVYGELTGPPGAQNATFSGIGPGNVTNWNGIDAAYIHLGSKPGTYTLTLNTRWMLSQPSFEFYAIDDIDDLSPDEEHPDTEEDTGEDEKICGRVANPITLASGNKFQREADFEATGISPIEFVRYHN